MINKKTSQLNLTKRLIIMAFLIALTVILTRILSINTPFLRISFEFIPIAFMGILFGPLWAGILAALADILGMALFPSGAYTPMFTISAFLTGAIYGLFLYKKEITFKRVIFPVVIITILINLILNTYWLSIMYEQGFIALLPARVIKAVLVPFIQVPVIVFLWKRLGKHIPLS